MESAVNLLPLKGAWVLSLALLLAGSHPAVGAEQELPAATGEEAKGQLRLRKTVKTRDYQGKSVEGEERVVGSGDSLWRFLIEEKGLLEKRFGRYVLLIGSLNPHLKKPDVLRVGDTIFIPTRPDEILGIQVQAGKSDAKVYRVKPGDYLYKILREQFGLRDDKELFHAAGKVKELNPKKTKWNLLFVGERILFPGKFGVPPAPGAPPQAVAAGAEQTAVASQKAAPAIEKAVPDAPKPAPQVVEIIGLDYGRKLPVKENLDLLSEVVGVLGNETQRGGEETLLLQEGTIRIDRSSFPIIQNPKSGRKVVLDLEGTMPGSLKTRLEAQGAGTAVVPVRKGASLHDVANSLLSHLGFQSLPANQPVVVQDGGVGLHVKGEWMVAAPEDGGGKQQMWIISFSDLTGKTPDYLKEYLSLRGMNLKDILLPISSGFVSPSVSRGRGTMGQIERWPADKRALVDSLLTSYQIPFSTDRELSVVLREGIRLDTKIDRLFEFEGKKFALLFRSAGNDLKRSLEEKEGVRAIEVDLVSLSSRNLISRLLQTFGERAVYREHRFPAVDGAGKDKLVVTIYGFFIPQRSLLLTDREIPKDLEFFFGEKGLHVVYFQ
ncbi:MAG: hypothetical protein ACREP8_01810 [Candidatus Binatia bacterium]